MTVNQPIDEFFRRIRPLPDIYRRCQITCLAIWHDSKWRNMRTELLFDPHADYVPVSGPAAQLPPPLRVFQSTVPYREPELSRLLDELSIGKLNLRGEDVYLLGIIQDSQTPKPLGFIHKSMNGREPYSEIKLRCPYELLESFGDTLSSILPTFEHLNRLLQSQGPPFEDLSDASRQLFVCQRGLTNQNSSSVRVIAPWHAYLDKIDWRESGEPAITVISTYDFDPQTLDLGFISANKNGTEHRDTLPVERVLLPTKESSYTALVPHAEADTVTVMLRVAGQTIDTMKSSKPVPGMLHLKCFSKSLSKIKEYLTTPMGVHERNRNRDPAKIYINKFEVGVMFVLQLCQWECQPYGMIDGNDVADGIALNHSSNHAIVYECSLETPNYKDKSAKLFKRSRDLQKQLHQHRFLRIMFTASLRRDVPPNELSDAKEAGVLVVCQEDLMEWMSQLEMGVSVDIVGWWEQRMPTSFWFSNKS